MELKDATVLTDVITCSPSVHLLTDYAGIQFFGLTSLPLTTLDPISREVRPLGAKSWQHNPDFTQWIFQLDKNHSFSDGEKVTSEHYQKGFNRIHEDRRNRFRRTFLDIINAPEYFSGQADLSAMGIKFLVDEIHIQLRKPNCFLPHMLSIRNFSPLSERGLSAGAYEVIDSKTLHLNRFFPTKPTDRLVEKIFFKCPKDLDLNDPFGLKAFEQGEIDLTSDTLFPAERVADFRNRKDFFSEKPGLIALFSLGTESQRLAPEFRKMFSHLIQRRKLSQLLSPEYRATDNFLGSLENNAQTPTCSIAPCELSVAYEDFYPNKMILESVAEDLLPHGIKLKFVIEPYGSRSAQTELRFEIRQSPIIDPYLLYRGSGGGEKFKSLSLRWADYHKLLAKYQSEDKGLIRQDYALEMSKILRDDGILVPVVEIPSLYLKNPKLSHFQFQPGHVWIK